MSRRAYIISLIVLFGAFAAGTALWQEQLSSNDLLRAASLAVLLGGGGALTMVRKRSKQASTRSRDADSVERRASERASEQAFEFSLVLLAGLTAFLGFAWGAGGFLIGGAALVLAAGGFWTAYWWQLRRMTSGAQRDP